MRNLKCTLSRPLMGLMSLLLCVLMLIPFPLKAALPNQGVYDYAALFTDEEVQSLQTKINEIRGAYNVDAFILTTDDAQGKTTTAFADDFLFDLGYGTTDTNAVLFIIDMDNRNVKIATSGVTTFSYFTDERCELIIDKLYGDLKEGNYYQTGNIFLKYVSAVLAAPVPEANSSQQTSLPRAPLTMSDYLMRGGIAAAIAFIVSLITYFSICHSYTHPKFTQPVTAPDRSSVNYTDKQDKFMHSHTTKVRIRQDDNHHSGGGGSSTHTSSGGGTFGGSGERGF